MSDAMGCGCCWVRTETYGDVLVQCRAHRAGMAYDGDRISVEEVESLTAAMEMAGVRTVRLSDRRRRRKI